MYARLEPGVIGFPSAADCVLMRGSVTAGNSSPMSDGAAAVVVMSDSRARSLGLKPFARFVAYATAGCLPGLIAV